MFVLHLSGRSFLHPAPLSVRALFTPISAFTCSANTRLRLGWLIVWVLASASAHPSSEWPSALSNDCVAQLDRLADALERGKPAQRASVESLLDECADLPQLHHNLAVINAREGRWEDAVAQLERAIALDTRAAESVEAMRDIRRWQAAEAYAKALGTPAPTTAPRIAPQSSRDGNSDTRRWLFREPDLYAASSVEYELWEWWRSGTDKSKHHREHYVGEAASTAFHLSGDRQSPVPDWDSLDRQVRFVGHDVVATISWRDGDGSSSNLVLLMSLHDERWRIYDELLLP